MTKLDKRVKQLSNWSASRTEKSEKALQKLYTELTEYALLETGKLYQRYEVAGKLTFAEVQRYNRLDTFIAQLLHQVNVVHGKYQDEIQTLLSDSYEYSYDWMSWAIQNEARAKYAKTKIRTAQIQAALDNPVAGLTLKTKLEKQRADIIYTVKREIVQTLQVNNTYAQTAQRLQKTFDNEYKKSIRVARTETHRVREQAVVEAAQNADEQGVVMGKKWVSMRDSRVRRTSKANHSRMDGQEQPVNEPFQLGGGRTGIAPGNTGYPFEDINCRCITTVKILGIKAQTDEDIANRTFKQYRALRDGEI